MSSTPKSSLPTDAPAAPEAAFGHSDTRAGAHPWRTATAALGLTFVTLMLLPFSDAFIRRPRQVVKLRSANIVTLRQPPPQSRPARETPRQTPPPETLPKPRLEKPPPSVPALDPSLNAELDTNPMRADASLSFETHPAPPITAEPAATLESHAPRAPGTAYSEAEVDRTPQAIKRVPPLYPYTARLRGVEGHVDVRFTVTPDGKPTAVEVTNAVPPDMFEQAALRAVRQWRFAPGMHEGKAVGTRLQVRIRFQLEDL